MLTPVARTRLEKAAVDNGFDRDLGSDEHWLRYGSTQAPLRIWLTAMGDRFFVVAFSQGSVAAALADVGATISNPLPAGAAGARSVLDIPALHHLIRRAFQLSRTLPDELLHAFEAKVAGLPRETEVERMVVQRVGQNVFRDGLLDYWEGRCAITGLAVPILLRASHIKPWSVCSTDAERLDVFNGLLLAPHLDAAFDVGLVTLSDEGTVLISEHLGHGARVQLGFTGGLGTVRVAEGHRRYLPWHREHVFRWPVHV